MFSTFQVRHLVIDGKSLVLVKGEKAPVEYAITTGLTDGKKTEVIKGVTESDIIMIQDYSIGDGANASNNPFSPKFPKGGRGGRK